MPTWPTLPGLEKIHPAHVMRPDPAVQADLNDAPESAPL
jgi:hypothetical protein